MKRLPRQIPPLAIARDYTRALLGIVGRARLEFEPVERALPALLARTDADEGDKVRRLFHEYRRRLAAAISIDELQALAAKFARQISTYQRIQLGRQVHAALGVDLFSADSGMRGILDGFVTSNVALIKDVPIDVARRLETLVSRAVADGTLHRDLTTQIGKEWGIAKKRAQLIARDQTLTAYGRINVHRQKAIGIRRFVWRTVLDRRVRGTPGGAFPRNRPSHFALEGRTFAFDAPPHGELPGEPVLCRCYAEPVFADVGL